MSAIAIIHPPTEAEELLERAKKLALEGQQLYQQHAAAIASARLESSVGRPALVRGTLQFKDLLYFFFWIYLHACCFFTCFVLVAPQLT